MSGRVPPALRSGCLIAFEGIDGAGKTTQARLLEQSLAARGFPVVYTKEPTKGRYRKQIEEWLKKGERPSGEEELRVFMDDREDHVREVIQPALDAQKIVLLDRYFLSTAAYQGERGLDPEAIMKQCEAGAPIPDIAIYLKIPVETGLRRIADRGIGTNLFERGETLEVVAAIFDGIRRDWLHVIDGEAPIGAVADEILAVLHHSVLFRAACWKPHLDACEPEACSFRLADSCAYVSLPSPDDGDLKDGARKDGG